ncbi:MAG: hypothetical protein KDB22_24550 [Planctomycetales bacterium]|nr:hypothetical protein [Planctomycetales bacterium]
MKRIAMMVAVALLATTGTAQAQENEGERPTGRSFGPPAEVVAAWENGQGDLLPGPPAWVIEMRMGASEDAGRSMPPWIAARHARAAEVGLLGPPAEAIEAWQNGEGDSLPGPPSFVREFFAMFWGSR